MRKQFKGTVYLLGATVIWGSTFVAQSVGVERIGPFTFLAVRCLLAVLALVPVIILRERRNFFNLIKNPRLWKAGFWCGTALFAATALQQVGLIYTTSGKSGFITAMYILLVPLLGLIFNQRPKKSAVIGVIVAAVGLYFISGSGKGGINIGDVLTFLCAVAFAVQILLIDRLAGDLDSIALNTIQSLVCAVISAIFTFTTETPHIPDILDCWLPLSYAGALSMGVAYTLQIMGQKALEPTTASLMMSFESVFAALFGWLILKETLTPTECVGCALVFGAITLSQLPVKLRKKAPA